MKKNYFIVAIIIVLLVIVAVSYSAYSKPAANYGVTPSSDKPASKEPAANEPAANEPAAANTIVFTDSGFSPSAITVNQGDRVTWQNNSSVKMWPASAKHPTHTVYPGSGIEKCGTAEAANIFDACQGIDPGSSYSFVFNEVGKWFYHDHLDATKFGSVEVKAK